MSPFIKTILPSSYDFPDELVSFVAVHSRGIDRGWLRKSAARACFASDDIKPEKGKSFLHLIAMGAAPNFPSNKNGDTFYKTATLVEIPRPKRGVSSKLSISQGLKDTHDTFVKFAKVYREHKHNPGDKVWGDVVKSAFNDDMDRVELIIRVDDKEWAPQLEKLASGKELSFSMSTRVPFDICSICGNKARNRREYCDDLKQNMGQIIKSGHVVSAINDMMRFFDISEVGKRADRIALGLKKVASGSIMSGSELAEALEIAYPFADGFVDHSKQAALNKLSDIEKKIEVTGVDNLSAEQLALGSAASPKDMPRPVMDELKKNSFEAVLGCLTKSGVLLSMSDFMELALGDSFAPDTHDMAKQAEAVLPGIFTRLGTIFDGNIPYDDIEIGDGLISKRAKLAVDRVVSDMSLDNIHFAPRVIQAAISKSAAVNRKALERVPKEVEYMAAVYGMYKVAFCDKQKTKLGKVLTDAVVLSHYIHTS